MFQLKIIKCIFLDAFLLTHAEILEMSENKQFNFQNRYKKRRVPTIYNNAPSRCTASHRHRCLVYSGRYCTRTTIAKINNSQSRLLLYVPTDTFGKIPLLLK